MSSNGAITSKDEHFFQFTRHLLSCNNIIDNPLFHHFEPSGTIYGIITAILFSYEPKNKTKYAFKNVYVSNLLRTWITATLLYGANGEKSSDTPLELYVCPHLKEEHKATFKRGNYPEQLSYTFIKFGNFLTLLRKMYFEIGTIFEGQDELFGDGILQNFKNIYHTWFQNLSDNIIIHIPNKVEFKFSKNEDNNMDLTQTVDSIGPNTKIAGYLTTGNLVKFMEWFNTQTEYNKKYDNVNGVYHVVTHSNIMKKYFTHELGIQKTNVLNLNGIHHTNLNSFRTKLHINELLQDIFKIEDGVEMDKTRSKNIEKENPKNTLCVKQNKYKSSDITSYESIHKENKDTEQITQQILKSFEMSQERLKTLPRVREIHAKQKQDNESTESKSAESKSTEPMETKKPTDQENAAASKITSFLRRTIKNKPRDEDDDVNYSLSEVEKEGVSKGGKRTYKRLIKKSKQIRRRHHRRTAKKQ